MIRTLAALACIIGAVATFGSAISAQTPPVDDARPAVVRGVAPVAPGTDVVIEVLDPATLKIAECGRTKTAAGVGESTTSDFSLSVNAECIKENSGNLRVCWGPNLCQGVELSPGDDVDLGSLKFRESVAFPPNVGGGVPELHSSGDHVTEGRVGMSLGLAALAASGGGLFIMLFAIRKRRGLQ